MGQLIDSEVRTEKGGSNYIKKMVVFRPRKNVDKMEFREDIPRRWLEQVDQETPSYRKQSIDLALGGLLGSSNGHMRESISSEQQAMFN